MFEMLYVVRTPVTGLDDNRLIKCLSIPLCVLHNSTVETLKDFYSYNSAQQLKLIDWKIAATQRRDFCKKVKQTNNYVYN